MWSWGTGGFNTVLVPRHWAKALQTREVKTVYKDMERGKQEEECFVGHCFQYQQSSDILVEVGYDKVVCLQIAI